MSKNKVIVLALLDAGMSKSEAARRYGVGRQLVHELLARYPAEGDAGLEPRSRRPRTNPLATTGAVQARILALRAAGTVVPELHKRPGSSLRRFTMAQPNEMWPSDFTNWALADGTGVEILDYIDDRSRYCSTSPPIPRSPERPWSMRSWTPRMSTACPPPRLPTTAWSTPPASPADAGRDAFETLIASLCITQKNGRPRHLQTRARSSASTRPSRRPHDRRLGRGLGQIPPHLQPRTAAPGPQTPHTLRSLRSNPQGRAQHRRLRRTLADPHRPRRRGREGHPPSCRTPPAHRHRPNP